MAHNFRILDGDKYISKSGHDSNSGTINAPKKTVSFADDQKTVIGSGIYLMSSGGGRFKTVVGDGIVKLLASNIDRASGTYQGLIFICQPGFYIADSQGISGNFLDCTVVDGDFTGNTHTLLRCKIINGSFGFSNADYYKSIFINTSITAVDDFDDNYLDFDSYVVPDDLPSKFRNNNIQGRIVIGGNAYAIQDQLVGTPQDNGYAAGVKWLTEANLTTDGYAGTIAGWDIAVASCMNRDPLFNDASVGDYSLQAGSPMVGAAEDGVSNIGGTKVALSYKVNQNGIGTIEVNPSAEIDTSNPTSWLVSSGQDEGYIDFIMKLSDVPVTLNQAFEPLSSLNFDSDYAGGTAQNRDVVDSHPKSADYPNIINTTGAAGDAITLIIAGNTIPVGNYVRVAGEVREVTANDGTNITVASAFRANVGSGIAVRFGTLSQLAALNPNRLTYELRTSTQSAKPANDSEWDNSLNPIYGEEGTFFTQEWFVVPELVIDGNTVYGGGDTDRPTGIGGTQIQATWINLRAYLRNDYTS